MTAPRNRKATDEEILRLFEIHGTATPVARALELTESSVRRRLHKLRRNGVLPESSGPVLPVTGRSTLVKSDGTIAMQWIKQNSNGRLSDEEVLAIVKDSFADQLPVKRIAAPVKRASDLLVVYPMGDPHIGMYAWAEETGADFDLQIAEHNLVNAVRHLVQQAPPAKYAMVVNVGDFFHADSMENRTMRSGHALDVDTRWAKVLRVGIRAMRACIEAALEKHDEVRVINEIGNHDDHTSQMLTIALSLLYENNPRVTFDESPAKFHYHEFGKNLIGVTHGDKVKADKLSGIMATDRPAEWGRTRHRYWYTGHVHTRQVFELAGCSVESFRTLAARDAWTAGAGYRSGRDMQMIALHKEHGEVSRARIDISILESLDGARRHKQEG